MISLFLPIFFVLPECSKALCFAHNPSFATNPIVKELSPTKLKVEWGGGIINDISCVDHFYVHFWRTNEENRNIGQNIAVNKNTFSVVIDVRESTEYSVQINAFEDLGGSGDIWSNVVRIRTSTGLKVKSIS